MNLILYIKKTEDFGRKVKEVKGGFNEVGNYEIQVKFEEEEAKECKCDKECAVACAEKKECGNKACKCDDKKECAKECKDNKECKCDSDKCKNKGEKDQGEKDDLKKE